MNEREELESLRAFAKKVMDTWPCGDPDGGDIQDWAIEHGLLEPRTPMPTEPCGEFCRCAEYYVPDEWKDGVICYRKTKLLTGS